MRLCKISTNATTQNSFLWYGSIFWNLLELKCKNFKPFCKILRNTYIEGYWVFILFYKYVVSVSTRMCQNNYDFECYMHNTKYFESIFSVFENDLLPLHSPFWCRATLDWVNSLLRQFVLFLPKPMTGFGFFLYHVTIDECIICLPCITFMSWRNKHHSFIHLFIHSCI